MSRRDSLDDFKEEPYRPFLKPKPLKKSDSSSKLQSSLSSKVAPLKKTDEASFRKCALCDAQVSEAQYSDHFTSCLKLRNAKAKAAKNAGKVRPITDFINVKGSGPGADRPKTPEVPGTSSCSEDNKNELSYAISLPYCPICGRIIKTDRAYTPHLKQCAKKYNVAPDLLLELSKKQMTLQVERPQNQNQPSKSSGSGKKRPAMKAFEMPSSMEDEELQLAVALSASVQETHVSHLPVVSNPDPPKRMKRQVNIDFLSVRPKDVREVCKLLDELISCRLTNLSNCKKKKKLLIFENSHLGSEDGPRLFKMSCSAPEVLSSFVKNLDFISEMPEEFFIDTSIFDMGINNLDEIRQATVEKQSDPPEMQAMSDTTMEIESNISSAFDTAGGDLISSTLISHGNKCQQGNQTDVEIRINQLCQTESTCFQESSSQTKVLQKFENHTQTFIQTSSMSCQTEPDGEDVRLSHNLLSLLQNESTSDMKFLTSTGTLVGAHRIIVYSQCKGLISHNDLKNTKLVICNRLSHYPQSFLESFIKYLYGDVEQLKIFEEIKDVFGRFQEDCEESEANLSMGSTNNSVDNYEYLSHFEAETSSKTPALPQKTDSITPFVIDSSPDDQLNEEVSPLPPIQSCDDWNDVENYNFSDCCFSSDAVPLTQPQLVVTAEENDLIADFHRSVQESEKLVVPSPISKPMKAKRTAAGKSRPRISIENLTSVIPSHSLSVKTPKTPAGMIFKVKSTPPYSQMATPNLVKLLGKYGVRKLPKKHMVLKLKEIHAVLQPKQDTTSGLVMGNPLGKNVKSSKSPESDSDNEAEMTIEPNCLSLLADIDDEEDEASQNSEEDDELMTQFFSQSSQAKKSKNKKVPKITLSGQEFVDAVADFIRNDQELYNDILQYRPLPFSEIYTKVRKIGNFACSKQQLVDFLDEQCVTFRLAPGKSHRPPPPPPVEKKTKQTKMLHPQSQI